MEINSAKGIALTRALALLNASGVEYVVRMPDGKTHGTLQIAEPTTETGRKHFKKVYRWVDTGYVELVAAMKEGEALIFETPADHPVKSYQKVIASAASRFHDQHISTIRGNAVELLIVVAGKAQVQP